MELRSFGTATRPRDRDRVFPLRCALGRGHPFARPPFRRRGAGESAVVRGAASARDEPGADAVDQRRARADVPERGRPQERGPPSIARADPAAERRPSRAPSTLAPSTAARANSSRTNRWKSRRCSTRPSAASPRCAVRHGLCDVSSCTRNDDGVTATLRKLHRGPRVVDRDHRARVAVRRARGARVDAPSPRCARDDDGTRRLVPRVVRRARDVDLAERARSRRSGARTRASRATRARRRSRASGIVWGATAAMGAPATSGGALQLDATVASICHVSRAVAPRRKRAPVSHPRCLTRAHPGAAPSSSSIRSTCRRVRRTRRRATRPAARRTTLRARP